MGVSGTGLNWLFLLGLPKIIKHCISIYSSFFGVMVSLDLAEDVEIVQILDF
jgi:hypothetical protein